MSGNDPKVCELINSSLFFFSFLDFFSGAYPPGCAAFAPVSPNVVADESVMKTDEGMTMEQRYTVVSMLASLSS